jgi:3-hydroxybutyryl-CoA dehydratase
MSKEALSDAVGDTRALSGYFDQLSGEESFETPGRTITESDLVGFSALTGDWHPQHSDASWAEAGPFGSRVAHGMMLLSYSVGLAPIDPDYVVALRGLDSVRFKRPVRIGETIRVRGAIRELRQLDDRTGLVAIDWKVLGGDGRVAVRAELQAIWRREPAEVEAPAAGEQDGELSPIQGGRLLV